MIKTLFIMGTGRSGTTVIADLLSQSKEVFNMDETHLFHEYEKFVQIIRKRLIKGLIHNGYKEMGNKFTTRAIEDMMFNSISDFVSRFIEVLYLTYKKPVILDKTPHNLQYISLLNYAYPNPYFLHVVRNPLDVYASMKLRKWGFANDAYQFIDWYSDFMSKGLNQWEKHDNKLVLIFEDFARSPKLHMKGLFKWLEIGSIEVKGFKPGKLHKDRYVYDLSPKEIGLIKDKCFKFFDKWKELA